MNYVKKIPEELVSTSSEEHLEDKERHRVTLQKTVKGVSSTDVYD